MRLSLLQLFQSVKAESGQIRIVACILTLVVQYSQSDRKAALESPGFSTTSICQIPKSGTYIH
jgi:hypothetical protein